MRYLLCSILLSLVLVCNGQYNRYMEQGDKSLEKLELNGAILKYLSAYEVEPKPEVIRKIANTYYKLKEWEKAGTWYQQLLQYPGLDPEDYIDAITCFSFLEQKDQVKSQLTELKELFPYYTPPKAFEFWVNKHFNDPCIPDKTKNAQVSYCVDIDASQGIDTNNLSVVFKWTLEDGSKKYGPRLKHCFPGAGKHQVQLSLIDSTLNMARTLDTTLTVSFVKEAMFKVSGNRFLGRPVNFYAFNLKDHPDYYGMVWELGDGSLNFKEAFVHRFYTPGTQKIILHIFGKNEKNEIYQIACLTQNWNITRGG